MSFPEKISLGEERVRVTKFVRLGAEICGRVNTGIGMDEPTIGEEERVYCNARCVKPGEN